MKRQTAPKLDPGLDPRRLNPRLNPGLDPGLGKQLDKQLDEEKTRLLLAALPHVPFDGWSPTALAAGARDLGLRPGAGLRLFPGGAVELVDYFAGYTDRMMVEALGAVDLEGMRVRQRIIEAVRLRLDLLAGHREAVRRSLGVLALPGHHALALRGLYRTVDAMWRAAGDSATDFNFYTKRALLAGVYSSTLLCWLNDDSPDFGETWAFLERRVAEVMGIGKIRGRFEKLVEGLAKPLAGPLAAPLSGALAKPLAAPLGILRRFACGRSSGHPGDRSSNRPRGRSAAGA